MDHAATSPLRPEVLEAMLPWLAQHHGNPSSIYQAGRRARRALDEARDVVAYALGAHPSEIVFTSGGTEADNLALKGPVRAAMVGGERRRRLVTTQVEHPAVLRSARTVQELGWQVTFLPVDREGTVQVAAAEEAIGPDTFLVSVMHANNEVGTIQPVEEVARLCARHGALFHVDAVQSFGKLPVRVDELGCDLLSLSAHKLGGPKGVGCLYVRKGTPLMPLLDGGAQEREMRAGTENVAGIVGFAKAVELALARREAACARLESLGERLAQGILAAVPGARRSGAPQRRVPGIVHFVFEGIDSESLLLNLDLQGIAASSGSACSSGSLEPSHVLLAMGLTKEEARGSLRLSLGEGNTEEEVDQVVAAVSRIVQRLRSRR